MREEPMATPKKEDESQEQQSVEGKSVPKTQSAEESGREAELVNRLKYMQADFENYRKRMEKDMKETEENASKGLVVKLLSVLDELDLAVKHSKEEASQAVLREGIEMVQKNLYSTLEAAGLERIEPVGKAFDPVKHEAVERVQSSKWGIDIVVQELRAGYMFKGRVIRPSMVKVELAMKEPVEGGKSSE